MSSSQVTSHETKGQKYARSFLAFALFLAVAALSLSVCVRVSFINPDRIVKVFSNEKYVTSLREDILDYTHEMLKSNMLPEDCLDEVISYRELHDISYAYAAGATGASEDFAEDAYQSLIEGLGENVRSTVNGVIKDSKLEVDENQRSDGVNTFCDEITHHITLKVEKPYMDRLANVIKIGNLASIIAIVLFALVSLLLGLIVVSIGKRHRAMRYLVHSVNAAALLDLLLVAGVAVVEHFKTLYIFPTYLRTSVMDYVNGCTLSVALSAAVLFMISLALTSLIWKMKKDSNS